MDLDLNTAVVGSPLNSVHLSRFPTQPSLNSAPSQLGPGLYQLSPMFPPTQPLPNSALSQLSPFLTQSGKTFYRAFPLNSPNGGTTPTKALLSAFPCFSKSAELGKGWVGQGLSWGNIWKFSFWTRRVHRASPCIKIKRLRLNLGGSAKPVTVQVYSIL